MTVPGKNAPGLKGYPTPNAIPEDIGYRVFRFPDSDEWVGLLMGAAYELTKAYNFYEWGELTPEEAAEAWKLIVDQAPYESCGCNQPGGGRVLRLNAVGKIEQLTDGEWTDPTDDYAIPPVPPRTEPTADERRCLAAANAAEVLKQLYEAVADAVADGADEAEAKAVLIAAATIIIGGWLGLALAALVGLVLGLFVSFLEIAEFIGADLWTTEFDDILRCILYECCSSDEDDVVTFDFQCVREGMAASTDILDPQVLTNIRLFGQIDFILNTIGVDGLNAAGATTSIETADCDDCSNCQVWEGDDLQDWGIFCCFGGGGDRGHFATGELFSDNGVQGGGAPNSTELMTRIVFPAPGTITKVTIQFGKTLGTYQPGFDTADKIIIDSPNGWYDGTEVDGIGSGSNLFSPWEWTGEQLVTDELTIWMLAAQWTDEWGAGDFGEIDVFSIAICFLGDNPFA